jgi:nicotinamidase-related amidase
MAGIADIGETYVTAGTLDDGLEGWMAEVAPYQWRPVPALAARDAALVVVDMTRPFVDEGRPLSSPNALAVLPRVAALASAFRAGRRPVLWLVQGHHAVSHDRAGILAEWWPTPILEGTSDVEMADGLSVAPGEKVIVKRRYDGFLDTDLELTLRTLGAASVVVCGVLTNVCPFATAMGAFMRGFRVYYPADATAAANRDLHVGALRTAAGWFAHVVRTTDLVRWVVAPPRGNP